jgi:hypothetical protein
VKVIVHRPAQGLEGRDAERLKRAYAQTIARRPDGVELDARVTADGVAIVAHDPVALISGARRRIDSLRFADLPADAFLRLDELMAGFSDFDGRIYIEIKDFSERSVHGVLDALEPHRDKVWFVSLPWKHKALRHVLARWQAARTNLISVTPALSPLKRARDAGITAVTFGWSGFNTFRMLEPLGGHVARFIDAARSTGLEVSAGLTNSRADLAWAKRMGFEMVWLDPHMLDQARLNDESHSHRRGL